MSEVDLTSSANPTAFLQKNGRRLTPQRMMVLDAIREADGHVSAEDIFVRVHATYPYANISTVYRTLEMLEKLGLVTETDFGEGRVRYHYADKGQHHHLICSVCGTMTDMPDSDLAPLGEYLLNKHDFRAELRHLAIFGHCRSCA